MKLQLKATPIYQKTKVRKERIVINEGSSRSSKTYSMMQLLLTMMYEEENILITVVRKTLPSLKATAYRDFLEILNKNDLYNPNNHNKTELTYKIGDSEIEFISVDNFEKVKGRKRNYLFCNEANELTYNDFTQLALRTTKRIYLDYNPSHGEYHWIEEKIKTRDDVFIIHSSYKENPFNSPETIREIERLKDADPNLWRIYGLGLMGIASARIYTHIQLVDEMPEIYNERFFGLDFGFNHPTALVEVRQVDDDYYVDEIIYKSGWVNSVLIENLETIGISKESYIFCDNEDKNRIEEIRRSGYNVQKSNKDVKNGIDKVKSKKVFFTKRSLNLIKESQSYSWKVTTDGKILDEPVKINDDACFTADTIITVPIGETIRRVSTGFEDVYEFMGSKVTKDHPYLTQRGFVKLDTLRYDDYICKWNKSLLTELPLDDTRNPRGLTLGTTFHLLQRNLQAVKLNASTGMYGKNIMVKYLKAFISTTKTSIHLTTLWIISNVYHLPNTIKNTITICFHSGKLILKKLLQKQVNGLKLQRVKSEEQKLEKKMSYTCIDTESQGTVTSVKKNMLQKQSLENSATIIAKLKHLGKEEVFSTVTSSGFFLANGVVVKNCDAMRYAIYTYLINSSKRPNIRLL